MELRIDGRMERVYADVMSIDLVDSLRLVSSETNWGQEGTLERRYAFVVPPGSKVGMVWNTMGMMTSPWLSNGAADTDTDRRRSTRSSGRDVLSVVGGGNDGNASAEWARMPGVDGETGNSSGDLRSRMVMDEDSESWV